MYTDKQEVCKEVTVVLPRHVREPHTFAIPNNARVFKITTEPQIIDSSNTDSSHATSQNEMTKSHSQIINSNDDGNDSHSIPQDTLKETESNSFDDISEDCPCFESDEDDSDDDFYYSDHSYAKLIE